MRIEDPTLLTTEMAPNEQVSGGLFTGETLQVRVTFEGSTPPKGVIVTEDCADFPGVIDDGMSGAVERVKPEAVTF